MYVLLCIFIQRRSISLENTLLTIIQYKNITSFNVMHTIARNANAGAT